MNMMMLSQKRWDQRAKDIEDRIKKRYKNVPGCKAILRELNKAVLHRKPDCIMVDEDLYKQIKTHCLSKEYAITRKAYRKRRNRNAM